PFLLPYHVVPQRLPFSDLLLLPRRARLPTLLAAKTISITDNFSLDHTLTHPPRPFLHPFPRRPRHPVLPRLLCLAPAQWRCFAPPLLLRSSTTPMLRFFNLF
ncbi:hypothetical protein V8G54_002225, partial [Vigna mungo]